MTHTPATLTRLTFTVADRNGNPVSVSRSLHGPDADRPGMFAAARRVLVEHCERNRITVPTDVVFQFDRIA